MATTPKRRSASASNSLAGWIARNDRGPHKATLPSGQKVTFEVPDSNALIRAGRLPGHLMEIAVLAAAYPDGADGYMADLAARAVASAAPAGSAERKEAAERVAQTIRDGLELRDWLVAHMLISPGLRPSDVQKLPEDDVTMLLAFAERRRDTDANGVKLPIAVTEEFARFRDEHAGGESDAARESNGDDLPRTDGRADGGDV